MCHAAGSVGAEKRSGGDAANGIPRYLWTGAVAAGRRVVVPITTPDARVTVGLVVLRGIHRAA